MSKLDSKKILNIILYISLFILISAFYIQYVLGHDACNLCIFQRVPYVLAILFILFNMLSKKLGKYIFLILTFVFFSASVLSFYHFGIEQGFFNESLVCDLNNENNNISKEELLKSLNTEKISCKNVTFRIFGLSLATINTVISLVLSVIMLRLFKNYEHNK
tara:strand:- start:165 stop:650 length:486 start_codon:yes stop_codon:yes gene_type:complete